MPCFFWDIDQGSLDWYRVRAGIPTASEFDKIITPKQAKLAEGRRAYQCRLVAERLLRWQPQSLDKIGHIEDGKKLEPFAVAQLEEIHEIRTKKVGFVRSDDGRWGASPDRVAGFSGASVGTVIECKCPTIPKQFEYLLLGHGEAYRCQVQGQLFVAEADKALFYAFNPRTPAYEMETGRDEAFIAKLKDCLEQFSDELEEMTERARGLGAFQAFEELVAPLDAERAEQVRGAMVQDESFLQGLIDGHEPMRFG
jgi:hypothetical protein